MSLSKQFLLSKYKTVKICLRRQPSAREFRKKTSISLNDLQNSFGRNCWSKLVMAAGDKPKTFSLKRRTNEELLTNWGKFARKINKIPGQPDWSFYKFKPSVVTYRHRFGNLSNIREEFKKFAGNKTGWEDVIALLENAEPARLVNEVLINKNDKNVNYKEYIPNILNDFEFMSKKDSKGFENGAALIYQFLGFDVEKLGKENTGKRDPDGIAYNKGGYGIIYDAKSRKTGYNIKTDDRRIIEYINKYRDRIKREGCRKIYFQIISSKFNGRPSRAVKNIKKETQVQLTLIKAGDLLRLLSKKIEQPLVFSLSKFEELLLENGVIETRKIDRFLEGLD